MSDYFVLLCRCSLFCLVVVVPFFYVIKSFKKKNVNMKKGRVLHWSNLPEKLQLSRCSFKSCYGVKDPGEIVVRLVGISFFPK